MGVRFLGFLVYGTIRKKPTILDLAAEWETGKVLDDRIF